MRTEDHLRVVFRENSIILRTVETSLKNTPPQQKIEEK